MERTERGRGGGAEFQLNKKSTYALSKEHRANTCRHVKW